MHDRKYSRFNALYVEKMEMQMDLFVLVTVEEIMAFGVPRIRSGIIGTVEISRTGLVRAVDEGTWVFRYLRSANYTVICGIIKKERE